MLNPVYIIINILNGVHSPFLCFKWSNEMAKATYYKTIINTYFLS